MNLQLTISLFLSITTVFSLAENCQELKTETETGGEIKSPNYPEKYPHNANCTWAITAPENSFILLSFQVFDIIDPFWKCNFDYVSVNDGIKTEYFCKELPPDITSTENKMSVNFVSDDFFKNAQGFLATYQFVDKNGVPLGGEEKTEDTDDTWDWEDEDEVSSPTTTPPTTTTTSTPPTTTTTSTTVAQPKTTSSLIAKILTTKLVTKGNEAESNNDSGISNNPGAMSGAVIGGIIGIVLIVFVILLIVAFVHWRQQKNKRIDLTNVDNHDGKTLIKDGKKYKKIVRLPEAETFPL